MFRLLLISIVFISCKGNAGVPDDSNIISYHSFVENVEMDPLLQGIQGKIQSAFAQSLLAKSDQPLEELNEALGAAYQANQQKIILYWRSYLQFYKSIYFLEKGDKERSEKEIDQGIDWMQDMKGKNSEDYALLALLQGFGIQFKGMKAMFISSDIQENLSRALSIDPENIRAYYVSGSNDFYTPEKYGGGQEAERFLLKAIILPSQRVRNDYLPSWGKEEAYNMLVKIYIKEERWDEAKVHFQKGIEEYPDSYLIKELASKLVGK